MTTATPLAPATRSVPSGAELPTFAELAELAAAFDVNTPPSLRLFRLLVRRGVDMEHVGVIARVGAVLDMLVLALALGQHASEQEDGQPLEEAALVVEHTLLPYLGADGRPFLELAVAADFCRPYRNPAAPRACASCEAPDSDRAVYQLRSPAYPSAILCASCWELEIGIAMDPARAPASVLDHFAELGLPAVASAVARPTASPSSGGAP